MYASTARLLLRAGATTNPRVLTTITQQTPQIRQQYLHQTPITHSSSNSSPSSSSQRAQDGGPNPSNANSETPISGPLGTADARGRTGGGKKLNASSDNAPPKPKVSNLSVPGVDTAEGLTEEQKREVAEHNRQFEEIHDRGEQAPDDKVDKKFWTGGVENPKSEKK